MKCSAATFEECMEAMKKKNAFGKYVDLIEQFMISKNVAIKIEQEDNEMTDKQLCNTSTAIQALIRRKGWGKQVKCFKSDDKIYIMKLEVAKDEHI